MKQKGSIEIIVIFVLLLALVGGGAYYFGSLKNSTPPLNDNAEKIEEKTTAEKQVIEIKPYTISYTKSDDTFYIKYKDKIYKPTPIDRSPNEPEETELTGEQKWTGLVDSPIKTNLVDPISDNIFSFRVGPNNKDFAFVLRHIMTNRESPYRNIQNLDVYFVSSGNLKKLFSKIPGDSSEDYPYPHIDKFSQDSRFISFAMFGCWNCGGHKPETMLYDLQNGNSKNIGMTTDFIWKENGSYEYKEYKEIPCEEEQEYPGPCVEDPKNLPTLYGQF